MARPERREFRSAKLQCLDCGHRISAVAWQKAQYIEELEEPFRWVVINTEGIACPRCGSHRLAQVEE
jgi:DNA-directed RNA polymerase subunit RPC12/RpoP